MTTTTTPPPAYYYSDDPFPHVVHDDFLSAAELAEVAAEWPAPDWPGWVTYHEHEGGRKRASDLRTPLPDSAVAAILRMAAALAGPDFPVGVVASSSSSSSSCCWWPDLGLYGAGLHEIPPGAALGLHLDAEAHGRLGGNLRRVGSAALFVGPSWEAGWGGELELWDDAAPRSRSRSRRIEPAPGRLVCFATAPYGSAPHAVARVSPAARLPRRSLALFFYRRHHHHDHAPATSLPPSRRATFF